MLNQEQGFCSEIIGKPIRVVKVETNELCDCIERIDKNGVETRRPYKESGSRGNS